MKRVLFVLLLASIILPFAYSANATSGNSVSGNGTAVSPGTTVNSSSLTISIADNAVIQRVGNSYFNNYISFESAQTTYQNGQNTSVVNFAYNIPYTNGSTTPGYDQVGGLVYRLGITVHINYASVSEYSGPAAPYYIAESPRSAALAAYSYGLQNITRLYITAAYTNSSLLSGPYQITWAALSGNYISVGNCSVGCQAHPGVYINTSTGAVQGQFSINPSIESASPSYALLGNFDVFTLPSSSTQVNTNNILIESVGIRLIAIAVVAIIVALLIISKRRTKARARRSR
ncbi:MAG: hypothetical protein LVQ95_03425 [Candidatus Micrarchaeales archaeon]|nr:hypothetical protein [Candidatus Micrarchaeales archaeon]